jgi:hypothetical protein
MTVVDPENNALDMQDMEMQLKGTDHPDKLPPCCDSAGKRRDLLRRFTPTPYSVELLVMTRTVRLETNSLNVVESALGFFARHQGRAPGAAEFLWRIISQDDSQMDQDGIAISAFSDRGLRFTNIGQRSFLAVDLEAREGIGFVAETLVEPEPKLNCRPFFDTLFCMSTGSLGITPLSAACVGKGEEGLLIFGPPNAGKTVTSYLAAKLGLEFHADHASFLEIEGGRLRVWGDLLPAIFRPEALLFLPELQNSTRRFSYPGLTVHYLSKRPFQSVEAHPINPVCSVFLNRGRALEPSLRTIGQGELLQQFQEAVLYREDDRFQRQGSEIFNSLANLPGYELTFSDPAMAATRIRDLLTDGGQK